jgi:quercetin dioxygenase-like cupin family protein
MNKMMEFENNDLFDCNNEIVSLSNIIEKNGESSWSKRLVNTENNSATLISQIPGEGNRRHYHPNWNEWWYIVDGVWEWEIEGEVKRVKKGDVVFIGKNRLHKITAVGDKPAIRLAVSREDVEHIYLNGDEDE